MLGIAALREEAAGQRGRVSVVGLAHDCSEEESSHFTSSHYIIIIIIIIIINTNKHSTS